MLSAGLCSIRLIRSRLPKTVWLYQLNLNSLPPVPNVALFGILFPSSLYSPREHKVRGQLLLKNNKQTNQNKTWMNTAVKSKGVSSWSSAPVQTGQNFTDISSLKKVLVKKVRLYSCILLHLQHGSNLALLLVNSFLLMKKDRWYFYLFSQFLRLSQSFKYFIPIQANNNELKALQNVK